MFFLISFIPFTILFSRNTFVNLFFCNRLKMQNCVYWIYLPVYVVSLHVPSGGSLKSLLSVNMAPDRGYGGM